MQADSLILGARLAGRYRLEEMLGTDDGAVTWCALDETLARRVGIHTLPADHPAAGAVIDAAGRAARFADPRFLRVLDAAEADGVCYVVKEWVDGRQLAGMLTDGPLPVSEAVRLLRDAASALAAAHEAGLSHLRLDPTSLISTDTGEVKLAGLALEAALHATAPEPPDDAARVDARGLGALLYVALTGQWPSIAPLGRTPMAPPERRLSSPGQLRAAVPGELDDVVDRILSPTPRHQDRALSTPGAVAAALTGLSARKLEQTDDEADTPPAEAGEAGRPPAPWPRRTTRAARLVTAATVLAGLGLLGWQLGAAIGAPEQPTRAFSSAGRSATPGAEPALAGPTLLVHDARDFDPLGNGEEHPDQVAYAVDDNAGSAWRTMEYFNRPDLGGEKAGVGLVLDLGRPQRVASVTLGLVGDGTSVALRAAAADAQAAPATLSGYRPVGSEHSAAGSARLAPPRPITARYLLVWLTRLPPLGGNRYQGGIADVVVRP